MILLMCQIIMCSAISLTLVNSHTDSCNVVLSFQTLLHIPILKAIGAGEWNGDGLWDYILQCCCNNIIVSTRCTCTCDSVVINMRVQGRRFRSNQHDESHHCNLMFCYAMHATSMRAITVIWCSFIPYHMLLSDHTLHKERRKGLGTSLHSSCPPQTATIHGSLTDTMHTIATVLLIASLNFCHTVTRNKA